MVVKLISHNKFAERARVNAAAPKMLDALQRLDMVLEFTTDAILDEIRDEGREPWHDEYLCDIERARQAVITASPPETRDDWGHLIGIEINESPQIVARRREPSLYVVKKIYSCGRHDTVFHSRSLKEARRAADRNAERHGVDLLPERLETPRGADTAG